MYKEYYKYNLVKNSFITVSEKENNEILKSFFIDVKHYQSDVFSLFAGDYKECKTITIYLKDFKTPTTKKLIKKVIYEILSLYMSYYSCDLIYNAITQKIYKTNPNNLHSLTIFFNDYNEIKSINTDFENLL